MNKLKRGLLHLRRLCRWGDCLIFILAIGAAAAIAAAASDKNGGERMVHVENGTSHYIYPLDERRDIVVTGPLGETHIQVHDGKVRVTDSPCRDKICIAGGWITKGSAWLACLPNRVLVRISHAVSPETGRIDAGSY